MTYPITNQRDLRRAFWRHMSEYPTCYRGVSRKRITNYAGTGKMHNTDTRCAWCDYVDAMSRDNKISQELAQRATLDG